MTTRRLSARFLMRVMAQLRGFLAGTLIRERGDMAGLGRSAGGVESVLPNCPVQDVTLQPRAGLSQSECETKQALSLSQGKHIGSGQGVVGVQSAPAAPAWQGAKLDQFCSKARGQELAKRVS
jgi:hypothetical protein